MTETGLAEAAEPLPGARNVNVAQLVTEHADQAPSSVALVEAATEREVTWQALDDLVDAFAHGLSGSGMVAGHRVAVAMVNSIDAVVAYLGTLRIGAVCVPVNPRAVTGEMVRMIADAGARLVVCDAATAQTVRQAVGGLEDALTGADEELRSRATVPTVVVSGAPPASGERAFGDLLVEGEDSPVAPTDPESLAVLLYTSGTSGRPRGAMLTHRALLANIDQTARIEPSPVRPDDVVLGLLPLFHVYGLNAVLGQVLAQGARLVLVDHFDAEGTLAAVEAHGLTNLPVAPPVIAAWAGRDDLAERLRSVRHVVSGAAPLDPELLELFRAAGVRVEQGYGLTEAAPVVTSTLCPPEDSEPADGAQDGVGRAIPGVELEIRDAAGDRIEGDDPGEIWLRGDNLFSGYWPDGLGGPGDDGWYATGDVGLLAADGTLTLVDRLRELVIVSGFNVYPVEVEEVIAEVDGVAEAAVVGIPDSTTGEAVVAFVVPTDADAAPQRLEEAITAHCETRLARFKWPRQVTVVQDLPHSATGKVAKGRLRAQARRELLGLA